MTTTENNRGDNFEKTPPSDDLLAGEYVLGVLDGRDRQSVQARIIAEPAFAALISAWEERLSPWFMRVEAILPAPHVWTAIRNRVGTIRPANTRVKPWETVNFWRAATGLAIAASLAVVMVGLRPPTIAPTTISAIPTMPIDEQTAKPVTVLTTDSGTVGWIASIDATNGKLLMIPVPSPADVEGRVHELWLIPPGQAPLSLGFVSNEKTYAIKLSTAVRHALAVGATLAITLEPREGLPHVAPSGPIVAKGNIAQI